jgi:LysM repeat protein
MTNSIVMKKYFVIFYFLFVFFSFAFGNKIHEEYINKWQAIAVQHMINYKIPASITLAQGILESGYGESSLAIGSNNHFGIKCGSNWSGETSFRDDDKANECFRKYDKAEDSFEDHASFLKSKERYAKLFTYDVTDYQSWAMGLKEAGYATHPQYAQKLIELIEKHNLQEFDKNSTETNFVSIISEEKENKLVANNVKINSSLHQVTVHQNKVKYIVVKKGDTFFRIAKEFDMGLWQLYKYNDFGDKKDVLVEGDIVYLQPKKRKAKRDNKEEITLAKATDLRTISQTEAIKLESLQAMNPSLKSSDILLKKGTKINLR